MNLDVSKIVSDKLAQLEADGAIAKKIEESLEKTIMAAITSELESYSFRNSISKQLEQCVSTLADDIGLGGYNGFIAEKCRTILEQHFSADISEKVNAAISDIMFQKHENIKLSDIFKRYRAWALEHTDESDKYERQEFHMELSEEKDGAWTKYTCTFADHLLDSGHIFSNSENPEVEIHFRSYGTMKPAEKISSLFINGHCMRDSFKVGPLTDFEAFILNLYYNGTAIIMDIDDVDDGDNHFDIDI